MSFRNSSPPLQRSTLDHRAINAAARLLVAAIWLERQVRNAPRMLTTLAMESRSFEPAARVSRVSLLSSRQFPRES
jgi:hypothetical protein